MRIPLVACLCFFFFFSHYSSASHSSEHLDQCVSVFIRCSYCFSFHAIGFSGYRQNEKQHELVDCSIYGGEKLESGVSSGFAFDPPSFFLHCIILAVVLYEPIISVPEILAPFLSQGRVQYFVF